MHSVLAALQSEHVVSSVLQNVSESVDSKRPMAQPLHASSASQCARWSSPALSSLDSQSSDSMHSMVPSLQSAEHVASNVLQKVSVSTDSKRPMPQASQASPKSQSSTANASGDAANGLRLTNVAAPMPAQNTAASTAPWRSRDDFSGFWSKGTAPYPGLDSSLMRAAMSIDGCVLWWCVDRARC